MAAEGGRAPVSPVTGEAAHSPALAEVLERIAPLWPKAVTHPANGGNGHRRMSPPPQSPVLSTRPRTPVGQLSFFSTFTTFGTPLDITVASLRVEHKFAVDEAIEQAMRRLADAAIRSSTIRTQIDDR